MSNEPVAWGWYDLEIKRFFPHWDEDLMENKKGCIPLYTHPAKYCPSEDNEAYEKGFIDGMQKQMQSSVDKFINGCVCGEPLAPNTVHRKDNPCYIKEELTDEEIDLIAGMVPTIPTGWDLIEFARAILRKANEK